MKKLVSRLLVGAVCSLFSCRGDKAEAPTQESVTTALPASSTQRFAVNSAALQQDFTTWWNYTYYHVKLSQDFVGLDVDSSLLQKPDFLARLTSGRVVPFKIMVRDEVPYYQLYPINEAVPEIKATMQQKAAFELEHLAKEGKALPPYHFTDITGKVYSPTSTKGKVVVLKCWYIGCVACVEEFPAVNQLVDAYKGRDDILFISLAFDGKEKLVDFLQGHELKYATVPGMKEFMQDQLAIGSYPTHILLDRAGQMVKVVDTVDELKPFLAKQAAARAR